jgi:hypothetical protein
VREDEKEIKRVTERREGNRRNERDKEGLK